MKKAVEGVCVGKVETEGTDSVPDCFVPALQVPLAGVTALVASPGIWSRGFWGRQCLFLAAGHRSTSYFSEQVEYSFHDSILFHLGKHN